jgi:hypothetical protein
VVEVILELIYFTGFQIAFFKNLRGFPARVRKLRGMLTGGVPGLFFNWGNSMYFIH